MSFTIVIPVFEETLALSFSKAYFSSLGINPLYVLDSKRKERRAEVEQHLGHDVPIVDNPGNYIEASFQNLAALSPTDWILRIDCDEAPNQALLAHAARFVAKPTDIYCGYDRDDIIRRGECFEKLKYSPLFFDSQFRLFNRTKVKFVHQVHTPGFHVSKWKLPLFPLWHGPLNARIYHLQRNFISPQQRAEKAARYDQSGQNKEMSNWILRPDDSFKWEPFKDEAFNHFFAGWEKSQRVR